ncbi:MAG: RDD family protein, partial [Colwellia sp.]|nr:RDD family protein [Colwellia sp.]
TPLSLWDSFGRYGGYGAGLATGLLGFIQIYWDPNRQAIHDKISATVVIDLRQSRLAKEYQFD